MFIKSLQIGLMGLLLCAATAWAGPASIQGIVKDGKGQPIKGADIRIESRNGAELFQIVKTDVYGRYLSDGLQAGIYRVTLAVHGTVKASIMNTKTMANRITELNFDLKSVSTAQATTQKPGKHMIWVPAMTGSHVGGGWVEVDENDRAVAAALNLKRGSAEDVRRLQLQNPPGPQTLPGFVGNGSH
jgi:hypothetical protein